MSNKFTKLWKKFGPYILFGTGISQFIVFENWTIGSIFIILGFALMSDND
jgi:hypothetical protein